uniref:Tetraspanin n=1 Tax=Trichobilharzia regenti TaxID=157069 RepID=A0AA85JH90_TRIRE|nr:unnamed protein product [Trichobilharzia regenti]
MGLGFGFRCLQILLVILNIGVFICGIVLISAGSYALNSVVNHWKDVEPPLQYLIIFVITLGCIILILGAIGLLGACTKSVCLLATYCVLLVILIICQITAGTIAVIHKPKAKQKITDTLRALIRRFYSDSRVKAVVDEIQQKLKCCGARSSSDYETTPNSCYDGDKLFKKGCVEKLSELAKKNMNTITICVFLFAFFQTICLLFAICAIVAIRQDD